MKKLILIAIVALTAFAGIAQTYKVESMENLVTDLSARTNARVGNDGNKCALLKVYVTDDIVAAHGPVVGNIAAEGLAKYIYLAHGTKEVELVFKNHMPLHIKFDDFLIPSVTGLLTYKLILAETVDTHNTPVQSMQPVVVDTAFEKEIEAAYDEGYFGKCYDLCLEHAGNPVAQNHLGRLYADKLWENYDLTKAAEWFRKAAEQGNAYAQITLGTFYYSGSGVTKDYTEAVKWFRKAAEQGNADAQYALGSCYYLGKGVTQNYAESVKWHRKAAEQGNARALFSLGSCYYTGNGVTQNFAEAVKWWRKAAEQGDADAQYNLGLCYRNGEGVPANRVESRIWLQKAADQGYLPARQLLK